MDLLKVKQSLVIFSILLIISACFLLQPSIKPNLYNLIELEKELEFKKAQGSKEYQSANNEHAFYALPMVSYSNHFSKPSIVIPCLFYAGKLSQVFGEN